jgi:hypothetical protein
LIYATYADGAYVRNFRNNAFFARHFMGADEARLFTRAELEASPIYAPHRSIFDAKRGAGYWAWKPWAILEALKAARSGDVVLYQDCGHGLRYRSWLHPRELLAVAADRGFIAGVRSPQYGPNRRWNSARCLEIMGCNDPWFLDQPITEAVVSIWPVSERSMAFVSQWLEYCLKVDAIRAVAPEEVAQQAPGFVEHRNDQAILTNLVLKLNAPVLEPRASCLPLAKSVSVLELDLRANRSRITSAFLRVLTTLFSFWRQPPGW